MSSFAFVAPWFLSLVALAAAVYFLHQSYQRRLVVVPSLMLWKRLQALNQQARPGRRLPHIDLPMLLQIAAVLLFALALARPLFGADAAVPVHKIYVLDASGSMRAADAKGTRFDAAMERLAALLSADTGPDGPRTSLILAGAEPKLLFARRPNDHDLLPAVRTELVASDTATDWSATAALAQAVTKADEKHELIALTDSADSSIAALQTAIPGATTSVLRFGNPVPNAGLDAHLAASESDPSKLRLTGTVHFSGGGRHAQISVSFRSAGTNTPIEVANTIVEAPPSPEVVAVAFDIDDIATVGGGIVTATLSDDALPQDNTVNFLVDAQPAPLNILVVGQAQPPLLHALASLEGAVIRPAETLPPDAGRYDLVVVDDAVVDRAPETNTLWVGHARIAGEPDPAAVEPGEITSWLSDHPLSRGIVWSSVAISRALRLPLWPDGETLLAAGDTPLIEARSGPHGREVRLAFDPTREWSRQTAFPQFLGNLVDWSGVAHEGRIRPACIVGAPCAVDARWAGSPLTIEGQGKSITLPPAGGTFVPLLAGLYRHDDGENASWIAVNPDWREEQSLTPTNAVRPSSAPATVTALWPFLIAGAMLVLCLEALVAIRRRSAPRWLLPVRALALVLCLAALFNLVGPAVTRTGGTVVVADAAQNIDGSPGLVAVGDRPSVAADIGDGPTTQASPASPWGSAATALSVAKAMLPEGGNGHVVLASAAPLSSAQVADIAVQPPQKVGVDVEAQPVMPENEVAVAKVEAPPAVFIGDSFRLTGLLRAGSAMPAHLTVLESGKAIAGQDLDLDQGDNPVDIAIPHAAKGTVLYQMQVTATGDTDPGNNSNGAWVDAPRSPNILVLSADPDAGQHVTSGLEATGITTHLVVPTAAPWLLKDWLSYDGYVLVDVPAISLNPTQQNLLASAVSEHGRSLLMFGGQHSFGPGGYLETPLDRLSPLSSRVPKPAPEAAVVFVLDRSGSMAQMVGDVDRLEVAKQATLSAISLLNPQSQVAVVAFDTEPHLIVPLQPASDTASIEAALRQLGPGGGTNLKPALQTALDQIRSVDFPTKHIVALTDGLTPPSDFSQLLADIRGAGASVSTIAIGVGSNLSILRDIAEGGGGIFHASNDFRALPSILSQETMMISDSAVEERSTVPQWSGQRPDFLSGLPEAMPAISGYVLTTPKPDAEIGLSVDAADGGTAPLLGWWQYGSGTVIALATDAYGPWSSNWLDVPGYDGTWSEVLRHFLPGADQPGLAVHLNRSGDTLAVVATALDEERKPRMGLEMTASLALPGGATRLLPLYQTHPGVYEGTMPLTASGDYKATVMAEGDSADATLHAAFPARLAYAPDPARLHLADLTGGKQIPLDGPLPVTEQQLRLAIQPNWIFWALCALALFMADVVARYGSGLFTSAGPGRRGRPAPSRQARAGTPDPRRQPELASQGN